MIRFFMLALAGFLFSASGNSQTLRVTITGIRSDTGVVIVSLFENQEQFKSDRPVFVQKLSKADLKDGTLHTRLNNLAPGFYGVAILDDENENGNMDYRLKRPTEGFGFSNYYHKGLFRPKFEEFSFEIRKEDITVEAVMKYIKDTD